MTMDPQAILQDARRATAEQIVQAKAKRLAAEESRLAQIQADPQKSKLAADAEQRVAEATEQFEQASAQIESA